MLAARRIALAALLLASAVAPARAVDPAQLETLAMGISRADAEKIFGPPEATIIHRYPLVSYELDYRAGATSDARLVFDYDDKLAYVEFTPVPSAIAFDPAKLDALALDTSEAQVRKRLGAPDTVKRSNTDTELVYLYPGLKPNGPQRHANLHFFNGEGLSQIMYAPVRPAGTPDFDPAKLAGVAPGLPETETRARLGIPDEVEHSAAFDTFTYYYSVPTREGERERRIVVASFWGPNLSTVSDGPAGRGIYRTDFNPAALASLKPGLSPDEVRALLGVPYSRSESTKEARFVYNYVVPTPLTRTATLTFAPDGTLSEFTIANSSANPSTVGDDALARVSVGLTKAQVVTLIGKPGAVSRVNGATMLTYTFTVPGNEYRDETLEFEGGTLTRFSSVTETSAESDSGRASLLEGMSQIDVKQRLGEPDSEHHLSDGTVVFDYRGRLPYGPDGGGGQELNTTVTFDTTGRLAKTTHSGDGAALLDPPAQ